MIGGRARKSGTILANVENARRRSECLGRIEDHLSVTEAADEGEPGDETKVSLLNWGEPPDEYIKTFKKAIRGFGQEGE